MEGIEMENIQGIKDYIKKTKIKKKIFGGYHKKDVHKMLDTVLVMFEIVLREQQEKEEKRVTDILREVDMMKEEAKIVDALIVDLNKTIASLTDEIEKAEEKTGNI